MSNIELKPVYQAADGTTFDTRAEAIEYMRKPKIIEALMSLCNGKTELANLLADAREEVANAFDVGRIRVVTKADRKAMATAINHAIALGGKEFKFFVEHGDDIVAGFKWPAQKRLSDEDKQAQALEGLTTVTEGNENLAAWIVSNKDAILNAFEAGKVKREVPASAAAGLAAYQAKKKAEKEAADAAQTE